MNIDLFPCRTLAKSTLLGAILALAAPGVSAASFDCAKARSKSERLICGDPHLSALDDTLAALAAAGKKRADNPRAYQRALDAAWLVRQKCEDIACVEGWYARRIKALTAGQPEVDASAAKPAARQAGVAAPAAATSQSGPGRVPETAPTSPRAASPTVASPVAKPNVTPGAQLLVIGDELGFNVPLTRTEFLERYQASGGQCGVSRHLPSLKALSRSVESDCWTKDECPAPAAGLSCKILRTAYDSEGRIVLFTTTLGTVDANRAAGMRELGKMVDKFAELGSSTTRTKGEGKGRTISASGTQGQFRLEAEVVAVEEGKQVGTFSVAGR